MGQSRQNQERDISDSGDVITLNGCSDLERILRHRNMLLLMVCMNSHERYHEQLEIVRSVAEAFASTLKVCRVAEDFIANFCRNYQVKGTPTFLVFMGGKEKDRILGFTDRDALIACVNRNLKVHALDSGDFG